MKPSAFLLALLSVAALSSCGKDSSTNVVPEAPNEQPSGTGGPNPQAEPFRCDACGMG